MKKTETKKYLNRFRSNCVNSDNLVSFLLTKPLLQRQHVNGSSENRKKATKRLNRKADICMVIWV